MAKKKAITNDIILSTLHVMDGRMATKDDLRNYATRTDLEKFKEEILDEIRPIAKVVDKDAVTVINHERRIARLEQAQI